MEPGGRGEVIAERPGRIARIRDARTIAPELVALSVLCLAGLGFLRVVAIPSAFQHHLASAFWGSLVAFAAPVLFLFGGWLLCLSRRLTWIEKSVGIASSLLFPLSFEWIAPHLTGWNETCSASEASHHGVTTSSYSSCVNGPNWVTHTVEWVWTLVPLAIALVLGTLAVRRTYRGRRAQHP